MHGKREVMYVRTQSPTSPQFLTPRRIRPFAGGRGKDEMVILGKEYWERSGDTWSDIVPHSINSHSLLLSFLGEIGIC